MWPEWPQAGLLLLLPFFSSSSSLRHEWPAASEVASLLPFFLLPSPLSDVRQLEAAFFSSLCLFILHQGKHWPSESNYPAEWKTNASHIQLPVLSKLSVSRASDRELHGAGRITSGRRGNKKKKPMQETNIQHRTGKEQVNEREKTKCRCVVQSTEGFISDKYKRSYEPLVTTTLFTWIEWQRVKKREREGEGEREEEEEKKKKKRKKASIFSSGLSSYDFYLSLPMKLYLLVRESPWKRFTGSIYSHCLPLTWHAKQH